MLRGLFCLSTFHFMIRFLARFVYKNVKAEDEQAKPQKQPSVMAVCVNDAYAACTSGDTAFISFSLVEIAFYRK
jgi:hypothetical protein